MTKMGSLYSRTRTHNRNYLGARQRVKSCEGECKMFTKISFNNNIQVIKVEETCPGKFVKDKDVKNYDVISGIAQYFTPVCLHIG